jgi:beta-galactosidase
MDTLGIWCEEIDALFPNETNSIVWQGKRYGAFDLCEIVHLRGAEALGTYGGDFYQGSPAVTRNKRGQGKAYFIAARTGDDFLDAFYGEIAKEAGLKRALDSPLPAGVSAQARGSGNRDFVFVMNFTNTPKTVDAGLQGIELAPFETVIIQRDKTGGEGGK